jgi:hypothetical protein
VSAAHIIDVVLRSGPASVVVVVVIVVVVVAVILLVVMIAVLVVVVVFLTRNAAGTVVRTGRARPLLAPSLSARPAD